MVKIVEVTGVTKDYGEVGIITRALRGVDLVLMAGEFTSMAGPSGSGKTTLLNIIGVLDRPTSGTVKIEGEEITTLSGGRLSRLRRDRIGVHFSEL